MMGGRERPTRGWEAMMRWEMARSAYAEHDVRYESYKRTWDDLALMPVPRKQQQCVAIRLHGAVERFERQMVLRAQSERNGRSTHTALKLGEAAKSGRL